MSEILRLTTLSSWTQSVPPAVAGGCVAVKRKNLRRGNTVKSSATSPYGSNFTNDLISKGKENEKSKSVCKNDGAGDGAHRFGCYERHARRSGPNGESDLAAGRGGDRGRIRRLSGVRRPARYEQFRR